MYLHFYFSPERALEDETAFNGRMVDLQSELERGRRHPDHENQYTKYFECTTTPVRGMKVTAKEDAMAEATRNYGFCPSEQRCNGCRKRLCSRKIRCRRSWMTLMSLNALRCQVNDSRSETPRNGRGTSTPNWVSHRLPRYHIQGMQHTWHVRRRLCRFSRTLTLRFFQCKVCLCTGISDGCSGNW